MKRIVVGFVLLLALMIGVGGCLYDAGHPFYGYYSNDGRIAVEYPRNKESEKDALDGKWYTPVIVHYRERGEDVRVVTNMCRYVDEGSCGNYALESKDGLVRLEDYSYGNSGDPDAIYTSITFRKTKDDEGKLIPLERLGLVTE